MMNHLVVFAITLLSFTYGWPTMGKNPSDSSVIGKNFTR